MPSNPTSPGLLSNAYSPYISGGNTLVRSSKPITRKTSNLLDDSFKTEDSDINDGEPEAKLDPYDLIKKLNTVGERKINITKDKVLANKKNVWKPRLTLTD